MKDGNYFMRNNSAFFLFAITMGALKCNDCNLKYSGGKVDVDVDDDDDSTDDSGYISTTLKHIHNSENRSTISKSKSLQWKLYSFYFALWHTHTHSNTTLK